MLNQLNFTEHLSKIMIFVFRIVNIKTFLKVVKRKTNSLVRWILNYVKKIIIIVLEDFCPHLCCSIYLFLQEIFIEDPLRARHCTQEYEDSQPPNGFI